METIRRKIASNPLKIRVDFTLTCTSFDGVDVIREALLTAKHQVNDNDWKLEFKMIAAPNYQVEVQTHAKAEGEAKLKEALAIIKSVMKKKGGHFKQRSEPTVVNAKQGDDTDVADLLESMKARDGEDAGGSDVEEEEDNDEGMGDVDLDEEVPDAVSEDEEEAKE